MSKFNQESEAAILPAGSHVTIMGCRITLLEDTKVEANQANLDYILKEQQDFENGIGIVGSNPDRSFDTDPLIKGMLSSMAAAKAVSEPRTCFASRADWRTNMVEQLLSCAHTGAIDNIITKCQNIEKYIFGDEVAKHSEDWRL